MKWVSRVNMAPQKPRGSEAYVNTFSKPVSMGRNTVISSAVTESVEVRNLTLEQTQG